MKTFGKMKTHVLVGVVIAAVACGAKKSGKAGSKGPSTETSEEGMISPSDEAVAAAPMSIEFVGPKSPNILLVKNYVEIEVLISNPHPSTKWNLYYSKDKSSIASAVAIAEDLPTDTAKVTWDTTFVESGNYYLFATLSTDGSDIVFLNDQPFEVSSSISGNNAPIAKISYPVGDGVYAPGAAVTISYIISDPDKDPIDAKLEYTVDGNSWISISDGLDISKNSVDWTIDAAAPRSARYRLRLTANDGRAATVAFNDKAFGVTASPVTFDSDVKKVLADNCVSCHSGALPTGNFVADVYAGSMPAGVSDRRQNILSRTRVGATSPMPPSGLLSDSERDLIQLWIWNNGAQN